MRKKERVKRQFLSGYPELAVVLIASLAALLMFYPHSAYAAASVSVSGGATWTIGGIGASGTDTTPDNYWTITGADDGVEDINIKVTSDPVDWSADENAVGGPNKFGLKEHNSGSHVITSSDTPFLSTYYGNTKKLDLWFQAPDNTSEQGPHTLTVTLTVAGGTYTACSNACEMPINGTTNCTLRTVAGKYACGTCQYCDGTNTTCQVITNATDPYGDCESAEKCYEGACSSGGDAVCVGTPDGTICGPDSLCTSYDICYATGPYHDCSNWIYKNWHCSGPEISTNTSLCGAQGGTQAQCQAYCEPFGPGSILWTQSGACYCHCRVGRDCYAHTDGICWAVICVE